MSSLIFHTERDQALIATDTLAVNPDGTPRMYTSKALVVPHLRVVIAGTGVGTLSTRWVAHVNDGMLVRGLEHLNYHTPDGLNRLYGDLRREPNFPETLTATIYQIGISEVSGAIQAYAYRSTNDFESERLDYGLRYKPECEVPEPCELPVAVVSMMESQRRLQAMKPHNERLYIGGAIQVISLSANGFALAEVHRFDDADDIETAMYNNFRSG